MCHFLASPRCTFSWTCDNVTYNAPLVSVCQTFFIIIKSIFKYKCLASFILYFSISCNFYFRPWSQQIKEKRLRFLKSSMSANTVHQSMSLFFKLSYTRICGKILRGWGNILVEKICSVKYFWNFATLHHLRFYFLFLSSSRCEDKEISFGFLKPSMSATARARRFKIVRPGLNGFLMGCAWQGGDSF